MSFICDNLNIHDEFAFIDLHRNTATLLFIFVRCYVSGSTIVLGGIV